MADSTTTPTEPPKTIKTSPCSRYERHTKNTENFIGTGTLYMAMDLEEGTEVSWVEVKILDNDLLIVRHHFDTIIRFTHPNLMKCHTYWIEENVDEIRLFFICEQFTNSLLHFIKRTKSNNKSIMLKTQTRICKQILYGLSYLKNQNPPFFLPELSPRNVFITQDGSVKLSLLIPNRLVYSILVGKPDADSDDHSAIYKSLTNLARIVFSMDTLDLAYHDLSFILKSYSDHNSSTSDQFEFISYIERNRSVRISSLFRLKFLFVFPSLRILAISAVLRSKVDLSLCNFDYPPDHVIFILQPLNKKYRLCDFPPFDVKKYAIEIKQGLHPMVNVHNNDHLKKSGEISRSISPTGSRRTCSMENDSPSAKAEEDPLRNVNFDTLLSIHCRLDTIQSNNKVTHKLRMILLFSNCCRSLESDFTEHTSADVLTDDLLEKKLIPNRLKSHVFDLISRALTGENSYILSVTV